MTNNHTARWCWIALLFAALAPAVSCAPSTGTGSHTERRPSRAVVTAEELSDVGELNLLDAITRLRPMWVRPRGVEATRGRPIVVYVDGVLAGGIQFLREIPIEEVVDVQFHDAQAAIIRWGRRDVAGVIEVTTR